MKAKTSRGQREEVTIRSAALTAVIAARGAELQSLQTADGTQWLWDGQAEHWPARSPILFPVVGRSIEDRVEHEGQAYPMPLHGFAHASLFEPRSRSDSRCEWELRDSAETRVHYPFAFLLVVSYRVVHTSLTISISIHNENPSAMPVGVGFHPALRWPLPHCEGRRHEVILKDRREPETWRMARDGLPDSTPRASCFIQGQLTLRPELFEPGAIMMLNGAGEHMTYDGGAARVVMTTHNLPQFALWTRPGAPFVCLEPWAGFHAFSGGDPNLVARPGSVSILPWRTLRVSATLTLERECQTTDRPQPAT